MAVGRNRKLVFADFIHRSKVLSGIGCLIKGCPIPGFYYKVKFSGQMQVCRLFFCKNLGNTSGILVADFTKGFIDQFRVYIRLAVDLCAEGALGEVTVPFSSVRKPISRSTVFKWNIWSQ